MQISFVPQDIVVRWCLIFIVRIFYCWSILEAVRPRSRNLSVHYDECSSSFKEPIRTLWRILILVQGTYPYIMTNVRPRSRNLSVHYDDCSPSLEDTLLTSVSSGPRFEMFSMNSARFSGVIRSTKRIPTKKALHDCKNTRQKNNIQAELTSPKRIYI